MSIAAPLRVFLIDDDEDLRYLFAEHLRLEGVAVEAFESAEDALAALDGVVPALVITDLSLAGMSGVEAATVLRDNPRTKDVPLLALTGHSPHDLRHEKGLFDRVLAKPVDSQALISTVKELIARRTPPG